MDAKHSGHSTASAQPARIAEELAYPGFLTLAESRVHRELAAYYLGRLNHQWLSLAELSLLTRDARCQTLMHATAETISLMLPRFDTDPLLTAKLAECSKHMHETFSEHLSSLAFYEELQTASHAAR